MLLLSELWRRTALVRVRSVRLIFGNGGRLVAAPLQDSDAAKLLQRRRQLFRSTRDDAVQVDRMLRDFDLKKTSVL